MAGRVMDPVESARTVSRADGNDAEAELFSGVHIGLGVVELKPGERAVLGADLTGREEVWYVLSGEGTYLPSGEGQGETAESDLTGATRSDTTAGEDVHSGQLAITRGGEAATLTCRGDKPLVLLAVRSPLPSRGPSVETVAPPPDAKATSSRPASDGSDAF